LFGLLPQVFNNDKHTSDNVRSYIYFNQLQYHLYDAVYNVSDSVSSNELVRIDSVVHEVNRNIATYEDIFLDINPEKVSGGIPDISNSVK